MNIRTGSKAKIMQDGGQRPGKMPGPCAVDQALHGKGVPLKVGLLPQIRAEKLLPGSKIPGITGFQPQHFVAIAEHTPVEQHHFQCRRQIQLCAAAGKGIPVGHTHRRAT